MYTHCPIQLCCEIYRPPTQPPSLIFFELVVCKVLWVSNPICCLVIHWLLTLPPTLTTIVNNFGWFFLDGFDYFFYFPLTANFSFDALGSFAMEVDLRCFASYLASGSNPLSVLSEHTCLMIILTTKILSYFSLIFAWSLIGKWKVNF